MRTSNGLPKHRNLQNLRGVLFRFSIYGGLAGNLGYFTLKSMLAIARAMTFS
jgi:hypothetical protein